MTSMTAVIIPDTVTIKPHVSFSKLKTQSSVQMYCNKKSRSRAAWGCISSCLVSTSSQQPSYLKWCITPLYGPVCLFILNEFHHLQSLIFQIHCCTAVKLLSITTPGLESGRVTLQSTNPIACSPGTLNPHWRIISKYFIGSLGLWINDNLMTNSFFLSLFCSERIISLPFLLCLWL